MKGTGTAALRRTRGVILCCLSALCFGVIGPIGVQAFSAGLTITTLIGWRFVLAAGILWAVVVLQGRPVGRGRAVWQPLVMGLAIYAGQSGLSFAALQRLPVGLTSLLLYTMPVMVVLVALLAGRESPRPRIFVALMLAVGGVAMAVLGPSDGQVSALGVVLDLGSAAMYTIYYLALESLPDRVDGLTASALICSGAAVSVVGVGAVTGRFDWSPNLEGVGWISSMALICTVAAITLLMVGIRTAGAAKASVVSCVEPITAVVLGAALFHDPFGPAQALGTAGVLAAVLILAASPARRGRSVIDPSPAVRPSEPARE